MARQSSHPGHSHSSTPSQGHPPTNSHGSHQSETTPEPILETGATSQEARSSVSPRSAEELSSGAGRSPMLPSLPKQSVAVPVFQPIGPLSMPEDGGISTGASATGLPSGNLGALGDGHRREAILELQETLKKDLSSTIFDESDLEESSVDTPDSLDKTDLLATDALVIESLATDAVVTGSVGPAIASPDSREIDLQEQEGSHGIPAEVQKANPERMTRRRKRRKRRTGKRFGSAWSFLWLVTTVCFSGVGVFAFRWMTSLPPTPDCQSLSAMSADVDRLHCAHIAAKSGSVESLLAGFDMVRPWTEDHPLFWKAQSMMERWTKDILLIAEATLYSSGLDQAVALLEAVPPTSPLADQVHGTLQEWNGLWSNGEAIVQTALDAVQQDQWDVAAQQVVELGKIEHDYWRQERANELSLRILAERQGTQTYEEVKAIADTATPDELATAIAQLDELEPDTFIWETAQADVEKWTATLANTSLERFRSGDIEGALALIQSLPAHPDLVPGAGDLVRFGYAQRQATEDAENWTPGLTPVVGFMTALAAAQDIPSDSPFYDQAQIQMVQWRRRLQDVTQLQLAQAIASTGHRWFFDVAIDQAGMVDKGQPRRLQAQTLLAHWRQEIERVEDRPQLALAQRIAEGGSVESLQQAIAQAESVPQDRALRQDADTAIAQWTGQIQSIEDQPILDSALALAEEGNLSQAITEASRIEQDRALYGSAQEKIGEWQTAIAIAQNQQLLARARSLAGQTRLTEAINVASGISSASPAIYQEARAAMAQWRSQRDRIWAARTPTPTPSPTRTASPSPSPRPSSSPTPASYDGYYGPSYGN